VTGEKAWCAASPLGRQDVVYFLHLFKTGGSTFGQHLERMFLPHEICPARLLVDLLRLPAASLQEYRLFWGHFGYKLADLVDRPMIYLTVLREPVANVLSIYDHVRRSVDHPLFLKATAMTLDRFVNDPDAIAFIRNQQTFHLVWWDRIWNSELLSRLAGEGIPDLLRIRRAADEQFSSLSEEILLGEARARLSRFAFVGLTDRLELSMRLLSQIFGWPRPEILPRINVAPNRTKRAAVSLDTLGRIEELTRVDARLYAGTAGAFERRLQ
jgi:hypothetical protein